MSRIDDLLRRLVLLGVPLTPASGCYSQSSCDDADVPVDRYLELTRPTTFDAGGLSLEAWNRCVEESRCVDLCEEHFAGYGNVRSCQKVAPDGSDEGGTRIGLKARVVYFCTGRRPEGLRPLDGGGSPDELATWLAEAAWLEEASVAAFERLARELEAHAAPAALVERARRARADEIRHARMMSALAELRGLRVVTAAPARADVRPLVDVAVENAREGCVRETLGAVVAQWQAGHAGDRAIRRTMAVVARDEAEHADLAWDVHRWAEGRLDEAERAQVRTALEAEAGELARAVEEQADIEALVRCAGLPNRAQTRELIALTAPILWSAAA